MAAVALGTTRRAWAVASTPVPAGGWAHPEWLLEPADVLPLVDDLAVRIVALTPADDFAAGHLPRAAHLDWPDLALTDSSDATIGDWRAQVTMLLGMRGVRPESRVVIYDGGTFYAPRLWWILHVLGHEDMAILNGGLPAWLEADGPVETGPTPVAAGSPPYAAEPDLSSLATVRDVEVAVADGSATLVDARSAGEYTEGHIPGAVNIPFDQNAIPDSGGRWKPPAELRVLYQEAGVRENRPVIAYCSSGVRSAVTWFTLSALGYPDVRLYSASFDEWSSDPSRPVESSPA
jgi:thiosulfate/3-mercaptopyruvate sulfurtransferase